MKLNLLAFTIPLFIILMLVEYFIAKRRRKEHFFNLHNSVANVSIGIAERLCDIFVTGVFFFVYDYLHKHYALFNIKPSLFLWILLLLCTDFVWYWYHRLAHEVNVFWAVHVVHHQSDDFNYTTSVRITVFQAFVRTGFWCTLPVIGFPPQMITALLLVHGLYPFFTHTRLVGNLGLLEYIFVTPSHHRVHHASNAEYLDKNYGDVFIIWDKLFGTFKKERGDVDIQFGLTKPLNSYSFLWQHFHFLAELCVAAGKKKTIRGKISVFFGKPEAHDQEARKRAEKIFQIRHNSSTVKRPLNRYVIWQMILLLISLFAFILFDHYSDVLTKLLYALFVFLTLINCGAIMEQKRWIFHVEFLRALVIGLMMGLYFNDAIARLWFFLTGTALIVIALYRDLEKNYLRQVYPSRYE